MLLNEMSGKTTLMAPAETPRVLVLAWLTGVGALAAAAGAARPRATAPTRTATAPAVLGSRPPTPDFPQPRIANPRVRVVQGHAPPEATPASRVTNGRRLRSVEQRLAAAQNGAQGLVVRRLEPELAAQRDDLPVDDVDLRAPAGQLVQAHRRAGVRDGGRELGDVAQRVFEGGPAPRGRPEPVGLRGAAERALPGLGIRHQLTHRDVEHGTGRAEGHVAEELLPDHEGDVGKGADVEAGLVPGPRELLDAVGQAAVHFADPYQPHPFVVHVPRLRDRRPEALGDPDDDVLVR